MAFITVRKQNRVLRIDEKHEARYMKNGYNVLNEDGSVKTYAASSEKEKIVALEKEIKALKGQLEEANAVPKNAKQLKELVEAQQKQIESLTAEITALTESAGGQIPPAPEGAQA